jgi:16S rRNA (adenine1518-N6/adenine1519-N6)-dimethyltransferase
VSRRRRAAAGRARDDALQPPEILRRLGVRPRKALGQHFLIDEFVLADIARACTPEHGEAVLEIGAGPGGLTEELIGRADRVVAVELDEELAELTRNRLDAPGLTVIAADVLDFTPGELLEEGGAAPPYIAVGNLPYYITQPIVRRLLEAETPPVRIVVMVQREVARRIVGGAGRESLLSLSVKVYGEPRLLFDVPSTAFWPEPDVQSAVIAIEARETPAVDLPREQLDVFFHLLRAGFASPRKQLHNALTGPLGLSNGEVTEALRDASIDPAARAQHLDLPDWERLYHLLIERHAAAMTVE